MTCPAKSIKDVHNITSVYLLICAHKVQYIFYPRQYFFIPIFLAFLYLYQVFLSYAWLIVLTVSVWVWLI